MARLIWSPFLVVLVASHAEDLETRTQAPACDESTLLQGLPTVRRVGAGLNGGMQHVPSFAAFIQQHNREYAEGSVEYEHRRSLYEGRARQHELLNARPGRLWTAGVNHLSDWTTEELSRLYGWKGAVGRQSGARGSTIASQSSGASLLQTTRHSVLKDEVSWTHLNASSVVRDQGGCGSCWAFASALMLETNYEIHQKRGRTFSAQELVDCVPNIHNCGGSGGCHGATAELAVHYAMEHGLDEESTSPYIGSDTTCTKTLSLVGNGGKNLDDLVEMITPGLHAASDTSRGSLAFGFKGWERLPENKYEPLMRAVAERGPVAVSAAAGPWSSYINGIFDGCDKDAVINHAVTLVGYGRDDELNEKFWLIQNSWSDGWGEQGRIRLLRRDSDETECGTDRQPEAGTGCDGGPTQVTVCGMCGILYDSVIVHF